MKTALAIILTMCTLQLAAQQNAGKELDVQKGIIVHECAPGPTVYIIDYEPAVQLVPVKIPHYYDSWPKPDFGNPDSHILTREQIEQMPAMQINDIAAIFPGVYQSQRGGEISFFGSRMGGSGYVTDGMRH